MRYVFGDYTLDTACYELHRGGVRVPLGPKPLALLTYLLQHRGPYRGAGRVAGTTVAAAVCQ